MMIVALRKVIKRMHAAYPLSLRYIEKMMSISCFVPRKTAPPPGTFWSMPSVCTACPRRSPSTGAARTRRLSRAIKRVVRPTLGFKKFRCARALIAGIETMRMVRKGQLNAPEGQASSAASQFYSLAF